jgi:glycogen debranching enzyme
LGTVLGRVPAFDQHVPLFAALAADARLSACKLITAHDGFTLLDLLCFNQKHNQINGEENRDGSDNNQNNNFGCEGLVELFF